jgi:hypothetical protein
MLAMIEGPNFKFMVRCFTNKHQRGGGFQAQSNNVGS